MMFKVPKINLNFIFNKKNSRASAEFLASDFLFYFVVILLVLKITAVSFFIYFPETFLFADITKNALIKMTNQERESSGINSLDENIILNRAAYLKAKDILDKDYFAHQSPDNITPWYWFKKAGYDYDFAGENLAIGFLDSYEVHQAWLDSFFHKQNILNPEYKEIGIAVVKGDFIGNETIVVVQLLGTPKKEIVPFISTESEINESGERIQEELNYPIDLGQTGEGEKEQEISQKIEILEKEVLVAQKEKEIRSSFSFNFLRFIYFNYDNLIQALGFIMLVLIIFSLLLGITQKHIIRDKNLILRTIIFLVFFSFIAFFDGKEIIALIPHHLVI